MKISEVITILEKAKKTHGDVELHSIQGDGHASWVSKFNAKVTYGCEWPAKEKIYQLKHNGW